MSSREWNGVGRGQRRGWGKGLGQAEKRAGSQQAGTALTGYESWGKVVPKHWEFIHIVQELQTAVHRLNPT